jgi:site-specific recombinase XerD
LGSEDSRRTGDGVPLLLDEQMRPLDPWNRFLRQYSLSVGPKSIRAYAYDVARFATFLEHRGVRVHDVTQDDLVAYRNQRQSQGISEATWSRELVVLRALFAYLVEVGVRTTVPWIQVAGHSVVRPRALSSAMRVRALDRGQWRSFHDVGLAGQLPDGSMDPSFRGRFPVRDAFAAELALTTGLRLQEWRSLLQVDFIPVADGAATVVLNATAKNHRRRTAYVPASTMDAMDLYCRTERERINRSARSALRRNYEKLALVESMDLTRRKVTYRFQGQRYVTGFEYVPVEHRVRLVEEQDGTLVPLSLFVGVNGLQPSQRAWHERFARANERVASLAGQLPELSFPATPHDLRHTFAVVMLRSLQRRAVEQTAHGPGHGTMSEHVVFNPLLTLQRLLGHASPSTTMVYLHYLDDTQQLIEHAFEAWDDPAKEFATYALELLAPETNGALTS